jgi:hypothetical protein
MPTSLDHRRNRRAANTGAASLILAALVTFLPSIARCEGPAPAAKATPSWPSAERTTPEELAKLLQTPVGAQWELPGGCGA